MDPFFRNEEEDPMRGLPLLRAAVLGLALTPPPTPPPPPAAPPPDPAAPAEHAAGAAQRSRHPTTSPARCVADGRRRLGQRRGDQGSDGAAGAGASAAAAASGGEGQPD